MLLVCASFQVLRIDFLAWRTANCFQNGVETVGRDWLHAVNANSVMPEAQAFQRCLGVMEFGRTPVQILSRHIPRGEGEQIFYNVGTAFNADAIPLLQGSEKVPLLGLKLILDKRKAIHTPE